MERRREEGMVEYGKLEEKHRRVQEEERWEKISGSKYNRWYRRVKGGIRGY